MRDELIILDMAVNRLIKAKNLQSAELVSLRAELAAAQQTIINLKSDLESAREDKLNLQHTVNDDEIRRKFTGYRKQVDELIKGVDDCIALVKAAAVENLVESEQKHND